MTDKKSEKKESFIVRKKYWRQIQKLSVDQRLNLLEDIFLYQTEGEYHEEDGAVSMLMNFMIEDRERDNERYEEVCKKNKEIALERERKKREKQHKKTGKHEQARSCTNSTTSTDYDNDSDNSSMMLSYISSNEEIEQSSLTKGINDLIDLVKKQCDSLGVAYEKQKDRYFAKFILTAKDYGNFCEKIGQNRIEFALNVLKASFQIKYRKGICSGPMKIYQNYADVYNETLKMHSKNSRNLIQSF